MSRLRDESGFTLIELLVGISVGMVVLLGAFTLVDMAVPNQQRIGDRVDASQRGRLAMENITRQLGAAVCVQNGTDSNGNPTFWTPFVSADGNSVTFYTDLATSAQALSGAFAPEKRTLSYATNKITETVYQGTTVSQPFTAAPTFTLQSTRVIASNVQPIGSTPVFSYWAYDSTPALQAVNPPSATDLPRIAKVDIAFQVLPEHSRYSGAGTDVQDSIGSRLNTDFSSGANAQKGPQCQL